MFACTESLLITLDVSYLYMRVLLRISEYFCCNLYVLGLGYSTNAKKKAWIAHCAWKYMPLIYILMPTGCSYALHGIYVYHHLLSLFYFEYKIAHIYFLYGYHLPSLLLIIFIMGALIY